MCWKLEDLSQIHHMQMLTISRHNNSKDKSLKPTWSSITIWKISCNNYQRSKDYKWQQAKTFTMLLVMKGLNQSIMFKKLRINSCGIQCTTTGGILTGGLLKHEIKTINKDSPSWAFSHISKPWGNIIARGGPNWARCIKHLITRCRISPQQRAWWCL